MSLAKLIRAKDIKGDTNYDIILKAWLSHKIDDLPEELKTMLDRWQTTDKLLRAVITVQDDSGADKTKTYRQNNIIDYLVEKYGISARTAWDDIANAKRFFLSCQTRDDKEFGRGVMIEWGEKMMWKAYDTGDYKAAAALFKELNDIKGLHQQSIDLPDYTAFQPPNFVIVASPVELGFEPIEDKDAIVKRILGESRREFLEDEAVDAEVVSDGVDEVDEGEKINE